MINPVKWAWDSCAVKPHSEAEYMVIFETESRTPILDVSEWCNVTDEVLAHICELHNKWVEEQS